MFFIVVLFSWWVIMPHTTAILLIVAAILLLIHIGMFFMDALFDVINYLNDSPVFLPSSVAYSQHFLIHGTSNHGFW